MFEQYKEKQPIAYNILQNAIDKAEYNHAYLIETCNYDDNFDFVISFVKKIFCNQNKEDYKTEQICCMIDDNNYPELRIINPDGNWIKKEQMMDLQDEFKKKAITGNKKIYIVNNADRLNTITANSILKFLEEPQEGIIAILICDNRYKLLDTIVSRCQVVTLNGEVDLSKDLDLFSKIGQMASRTKEEYNLFLEDEINKERILGVIEFIKYFENNGKKTIYYINKYWNSLFQTKETYYLGLVAMLMFYQDVLNLKLNCEIKTFNEYIPEIEKVEKKNDIKHLLKKLNIIDETIQKLDYNANLSLLMDKLIIEMEGD